MYILVSFVYFTFYFINTVDSRCLELA